MIELNRKPSQIHLHSVGFAALEAEVFVRVIIKHSPVGHLHGKHFLTSLLPFAREEDAIIMSVINFMKRNVRSGIRSRGNAGVEDVTANR